MKSLIRAINFLTIVRLTTHGEDKEDLKGIMRYFPVVGALIGGFLFIFYAVISRYLPTNISLSLVVLLGVIITGGIHLDGLSDTIDGFFSSTGKADILKIMNDSTIGVFGTAAIFFALLLKFLFLTNITAQKLLPALCVNASLGRWASVFAGKFFIPAKKTGLAASIISVSSKKDLPIATIFVLMICVYFIKFKAIAALLCAMAIAIIIGLYSRKKIGGITGDILGAIIEITEISILSLFTLTG